MPVDVIPIDAIFPRSEGHSRSRDTRVGQATDYNKLILEV
jgi:DNA-directed RNA polymerase alpha subunit